MSSYRFTSLETIEVLPKKKSGPLLIDSVTLAFFLGFTNKALWYAVAQPLAHYTVFTKVKASGGLRTLHNPSPFMRLIGINIRRKILKPLCDQLGPHVTAYRIGQSTVQAAERHLEDCAVCAPADGEHTCWFETDGLGHARKKNANNCTACYPVKPHDCPRRGVKIHLDLSDFFGSTKRSWIRKYFHEVCGYNHEVSGLLASLLTVPLEDATRRREPWRGVPQGGKASGDITNLVADWLLDGPLMAMLPKDVTYSRYADDLYFSTPRNLSFDETNQLLNRIRTVIRRSGYRVNEKKTHVQRAHKQQKLLGVVLNQKLNIPRTEYRYMRTVLNHCYWNGFEPVAAKKKLSSGAELRGWLEGKLAYYANVSPYREKDLRARYEMAKEKHQVGSELTFTFGSTTP